MITINKLIKAFLYPRKIGCFFLQKTAGLWHNDKLYLKLMYFLKLGNCADFDKPNTFNEKLNWIKLYDRKPLYTVLVDKSLVKDYVAKKIGTTYVIPTIKTYETSNDIEWETLPNRYVIKTTHGGGSSGVVIVKDKNKIDIHEAKEKIDKSLNTDLYIIAREWPYKNVKKRIIIEKFVEDEAGELCDYKFFCFNGVAKFFKVDFDRFTNHKANYYDRNLNPMPYREKQFLSDFEVNKIPNNIYEMFEIADRLAEDIPFVRVDLYNVSGKILFGEMTFFPDAGFCHFAPDSADKEIGDLLILPSTKIGEGGTYC